MVSSISDASLTEHLPREDNTQVSERIPSEFVFVS